ncbi:MAG TPA: hypothetical protein VKZ49_08230 [Polyangiaceae bacterium]|nr:hypothetical protein [Polyangiaceae bacterium]
MVIYFLVRFAKFVAVAVLFTGTIGTLFAKEQPERDRFALGLALPGWVLTSGIGIGLASVTGTSLLAGWILSAMGLSTASILLLLFYGSRRRGVLPVVVCLAPLLASLAMMVFRWPQ